MRGLTLPVLLSLSLACAPALVRAGDLLSEAEKGGLQEGELQAAYAACLAGFGEAERLVSVFTDAGWSLADPQDPEGFDLSHSAELRAMVRQDGQSCAIWSGAEGYGAARAGFERMAASRGIIPQRVVLAEGCKGWLLSGGISVALTAAASHPACVSEKDSLLHIAVLPGI